MSDEQPGSPTDDPLRELGQLRDILLSDERRRLDELEAGLAQRSLGAEELSAVLPEAVILGTESDQRLEVALAPTLERSIQSSVRRNPESLAQAIYPVIGPAIRRSIRQALADLVQSINRTLEHSLSPRGLRWRLEALRTGRPFAEIVLKNSLLFRVEQVLLIHRPTSLLLQHVTAPEVGIQDPEMVSALLGAIQDFVGDAFGQTEGDGEGDESGDREGIAQVEFGAHVLHVARGPRALVACVVRGIAPPSLRLEIEQTLEALHRDHGAQLESFDGECSGFEACKPALSALLVAQEAPERPPGPLRHVLPALLVVVLLLGTVSLVRSSIQSGRWRRTMADLDAQPGIVLVHHARHGAGGRVSGLRDPQAADPAQVLAEAGFDPAQVEWDWTPFQSLDGSLVEARLRHLLEPPDGVRLDLSDGELRLTGSAPSAWHRRLALTVAATPGVSRLDTSGLANSDLDEVRRRAASLDGQHLAFPAGDDRLPPTEVRELLSACSELERSAQRAGQDLRLTMCGRVARTEGGSVALGWRRSRFLREELAAVLGAGSVLVENPPQMDSASPGARITIELIARDSAP